jgi:hypothetical protein
VPALAWPVSFTWRIGDAPVALCVAAGRGIPKIHPANPNTRKAVRAIAKMLRLFIVPPPFSASCTRAAPSDRR